MTEFSITRVFDAPRKAVWQAWTHAESLALGGSFDQLDTYLATSSQEVVP
jgi:hypothetical protein